MKSDLNVQGNRWFVIVSTLERLQGNLAFLLTKIEKLLSSLRLRNVVEDAEELQIPSAEVQSDLYQFVRLFRFPNTQL